MKGSGEENIAAQAKGFLTALSQTNEPLSATIADDLLVFFYRLRDQYRIVQSTSDRFKGPSFSFLNELLYQLESRPDGTLQSAEWRSFVEVLLSEIASGKTVVARQ